MIEDLAAVISEFNRFAGKPPVSVAEVQHHVTAGDLVAWLEDGFEGRISEEQYRALMWLADQV
jgi:hypothetical protein